ncbi:hypothetical protein WUBG_00823 [Wuchereria bancrofti]|uniref:Uncharacterized protein n=1 Tax=Wuchereria bancrofti TaxID=6293 RepID=J9FLK0_WUCBA|nr:hypothetical protein WUBG_00823 [Wuchereria bancrofti]
MSPQARSLSIVSDNYGIMKKTLMKLLSGSDDNISTKIILEAPRKSPRLSAVRHGPQKLLLSFPLMFMFAVQCI